MAVGLRVELGRIHEGEGMLWRVEEGGPWAERRGAEGGRSCIGGWWDGKKGKVAWKEGDEWRGSRGFCVTGRVISLGF